MKIVRVIPAILCVATAIGVILAAGLPDRRFASAIVPFRPGETPIAPEIGALAPPLDLTDLRGAKLNFASLRGKIIVLNFWATWCGPCIAEMPALDAVARAHPDVQVIGVNYGESPADILNWNSCFRLTYSLIPDPEQRIAQLYRVRAIPTTFFIGREGAIFFISIGPMTLEEIERRFSQP